MFHEQGKWEEPYMQCGNDLRVKTELVDNELYDVYRFDGKRFKYIGEGRV